MIYKLYDEIKKQLIKNYKFILIMILIVFIMTFKLPYTILMPGGVIDLSDRVKIDNENDINGSLNMVYVYELRATIPFYLYALIDSNWDLEKLSDEEVIYEENIEMASKIALNEGNDNATIVAFDEAGLDYTVSNEKVYVTYIFEEANTTLKLADQIIEIDGEVIINKEHILEIFSMKKAGDKISILTNNGEKEATLIESDGRTIIGIQVSEEKDINTEKDIEFEFRNSESGSSGGLMMSLAIYDTISSDDITNGRKIAGTGSILETGEVLPIGGVKYKLKTAEKEEVDVFFVPLLNKEEAELAIKEEELSVNVIYISTFKEVLEYLEKN